MMANFNWSHNFPFKLFLCIWRTDVIFDLFDCNFSTPPLPFENLRRVPKAYFFLKPERRVINNILLCTFLNFLNNEPFEVNKATITSEILFRNINLFYFWYHLLLLLLQSFLLTHFLCFLLLLRIFFLILRFRTWFFILEEVN